MITRALNALGLMKRSEHEDIWLKLDWDNACLSEQIEAERAKFKLAATDLEGEVRDRKQVQYDLARARLEIEALRPDAQKWRAYLKRSRDRRAGKAVKS